MRKLFEKSSPPVSNPTGGMRMSLTSELMIPPKAAPIITPTARSTAFPLTANSLNSFHIPFHLKLVDNNVYKPFRHRDHVTHGFISNPLLNLRVRQRGGFHLFIRCENRHLHSIADLSINLKD